MHQKLDTIANIVRSLTPVGHPGPLVPLAIEEDLVRLFEKRLNALRAPGDDEPAVIHVKDADEAARKVGELCRDVPPNEVIWQGDPPPVLRRALPPNALRHDRPQSEPRDFSVGITGAAALIASTGTVVLELSDATDGWPSLLVDRHIAVAGRDQLLPDLPTFYRRLSDRYDADGRLPIHICITGCSRTADIEKLLVIPAHGPRRIRVILSQAPVGWGTRPRDAPST
ncbi:MAG: LUD domain-containing protein [Phycisphaerae bacterium]|nr:LUD domain-containing protein [Phycisphaerae bacterium]